MLSKVRIYNEDRSDYVELSIGLLGASGGYGVQNIDGLGPVDAAISYTNYALLDGGVYNSSNMGVRNIVITTGYQPNYAENQTVQSMRAKLNLIAATKREVRVDFFDDNVWTYSITGHVESNTPNIFSQEPSSVISIIWVEPAFFAVNPTTINATTGVVQSINYLGDYEDGFIVNYQAAVNSNYFRILNLDTSAELVINKSVLTGQRILVNLRPGWKHAELQTSGGSNLENLMGRVVITNGWPTLRHGINRLVVYQSTTPSSSYTLTYRDRWSGL